MLCLALAMTAPTVALADLSYYVGFGGGGSRIERDDIDLSFTVLTTGVIAGLPPYDTGPGPYVDPATDVNDPEGTDFAWKVFGGVRYGKYFGLELGHVDLGTAEDAFPFTIAPIFRDVSGTPTPVRPEQDRQIDVETEIDGQQLYLMGFWPLSEQVELFGKIGMFSWDRDTLIIDRIAAISVVDQPTLPAIQLDGQNWTQTTTSDDGEDLAAGFGLHIKASEHVMLRGEFEWFDIEGTSQAWLGSVSLVFAF
jgi:opacity protein-like surface antigen